MFHVARLVEGSKFDYGQNLFLPSSFFSFSFCLDFFLVIAILFGFFVQLKIFRFINFLLDCLIFPFHRSPSRGPAIDVFLSVPVVFSRT